MARLLESAEHYHKLDEMLSDDVLDHWYEVALGIDKSDGSRHVFRKPATFRDLWKDQDSLLHYRVITGDVVQSHINSLFNQYFNLKVLESLVSQSIRRLCREQYDELSRLHIRIFEPGHGMPWHRDPSGPLALLFLNSSGNRGCKVELRTQRGGTVHKVKSRKGSLIIFDSEKYEHRITNYLGKDGAKDDKMMIVSMRFIHPFRYKEKWDQQLNAFLFGKMAFKDQKDADAFEVSSGDQD